MSTLITVLVMLLSTATTLGNYWFTYGLWPQSWAAYIGFLVLQAILAIIAVAARDLD